MPGEGFPCQPQGMEVGNSRVGLLPEAGAIFRLAILKAPRVSYRITCIRPNSPVPGKDSLTKPALYHISSRVVDRRFVFDVEEKEHFRMLMRMCEKFTG